MCIWYNETIFKNKLSQNTTLRFYNIYYIPIIHSMYCMSVNSWIKERKGKWHVIYFRDNEMRKYYKDSTSYCSIETSINKCKYHYKSWNRSSITNLSFLWYKPVSLYPFFSNPLRFIHSLKRISPHVLYIFIDIMYYSILQLVNLYEMAWPLEKGKFGAFYL